MWLAALTALSFVVIGVTLAGAGWLIVMAIGFLQPLLLPLAAAGILAYLLDPVVNWLTQRRLRRTWAVVLVFAAIFLVATLLALWVVPSITHQGASFARSLPEYNERAKDLLTKTVAQLRHLAEMPVFQKANGGDVQADPFNTMIATSIQDGLAWVQDKAPALAGLAGNYLMRGLGGALGAFGLLLSMVLVPIFLFFFLKEGPEIAATWSNYLPLRASPFKSEVVSLLSEINNYLICFFRGQLLVSLIDGALIAVALLVLGMDFAVLIGMMVGVLGLIPYAGVFISWIPAVLIATAQWGDWMHPLIVTIIFLVVNNLDGIVIAPKIVGESVGLHPLTVIISVLAWSIILGGLLGALLAVPLTATLKVLLKRYFWDRPAPESVGISSG